MSELTPPVYAIYARLSRKARDDDDDDQETVERQEALCRRYAAENGLAVDARHVYIDNHRSAWKADGPRERWDEMMLAGKRGEFDGMLAYKLDRFARNVRDAEDLVDLAENRRVMVDGPKSGRIDLSTASGRMQFRQAAVHAAAESDDTSERVKDALIGRTARGLLLGGGRLYGFKVLSEERKRRKDVDARQDPAEVAVIREAATRMLAGEHLAHIAADFNERGITTARGGQWASRNLGRMLGAPRYGGYSTLNGEVVGRAAGEPILDADTYAQVQAVLAGRKRGKRATGLWPLTGELQCGKCGRTMAGHTSSRQRADGIAPRYYVCSLTNGGCGMSVLAEPVEELVKARVLADVNDPALMAELSAESAALGDVRAAAQAEVERLDVMLADLEVKRVAGQVRPHAYEAAKGHLDKLVAAAETTLREVGAPAPGGEVLPAVSGELWDAMTAAEKRTLIARLHLEVAVSPQLAGAARNRFDPRRVQIRP